MTYVDVFGGEPVTPSPTSYQAIALSANLTLTWPDLQGSEPGVVSQIMDVTPSGAGLSITLPDAREASPGRSLLIRNFGANSFTVLDAAAGSVVAVAVGEVKYIYLASNTTLAGLWRVISFGVGTSSADAATLAGYGMEAIGATLNQDMPVTELTANYAALSSDRGKLLTFTTGSATCTLPTATSVGDGYFVGIRNAGTGTVTIDPNGTETLDGQVTFALAPSESLTVVCSGSSAWYSMGHGRSTLFLYSKLTRSVAGASDVTLSAAESAHQLMEFTGTLTGNINVIVPAVSAIYYVQNSTTGAFTLTVKTAAGTGVLVVQSRRQILVCDSVNVALAQDSPAASATSMADGTEGAPSLAFASDPDTGFYRVGTNLLGVSAQGTGRFFVGAAKVSASVPVAAPDGAVSAPGLAFDSELGSGLYRIGTSNVGLAVSGVKALDVTNAAVRVKDSFLTIQDDADTTKQLQFQLSGITTGTTRTLTAPNHNGKVATDVPHLGHPVNARLFVNSSGQLDASVLRGEGGGSVPTAADPISVAMRSGTTLQSQQLITRYITASPGLVISSGATMGHQAAVPQDLYWYLIDNAGTIELAASATYFGISGIASTTAMSAAADSATVMYSTTARTNVSYVLFARTVHVESLPGTWNSEPTETYYAPFDITPPATTPLSGFRNKIIGGDFTTNPWQLGTTFTAPTSVSVTADCWKIAYVTSAVVDVLKTADAPTPVQTGGHYTQHCLHVDVTTADASIAATDQMNMQHIIEGLNAAPFGFGQAGTRYVTLSFWVKAAKTGIHCAALQNGAGNRSYVKEYTINAADTWEKKILTFPVDTTGTWLYDSGIGLRVRFALATGANFQTTANTWAAGSFHATSNQVNELDNAANNFKLALVQLEAGTVATPFEARDVGTELALCQRYLPVIAQPSSYLGVGQCTATTTGLVHVNFQVPTRIAVTGVTVSAASDFQVLNAAGTGQNCTSVTFGTGNQLGCALSIAVASGLVAGNATFLYAANANSKLTFTGAEL